jgi:hypothetical protein
MDYENNIIKIQRFIRKKNILKFLFKFHSFDLLNVAKNSSFVQFSRYLMNKELIETVKQFILSLERFSNKKLDIKPQIFLTSYLLVFFNSELMENEKHELDNLILDWSNYLIKKTTTLLFEKDFTRYYILLINFDYVFKQWKDYDKNKTIEAMIISYHYRCEHQEKIKNENSTQKEKMLQELEKQKVELEKNIKKCNSTKTINKAYIDCINEQLNNNNFYGILDLYKNVVDNILQNIPSENKEQFKLFINQYDFYDLIKNKTISTELYQFIYTLHDISNNNNEKYIEFHLDHFYDLPKILFLFLKKKCN